eukprot:Plantae.Rhodophyta-Purpureofilum_apyrenoidigerum.ctg25137.p2 GENE.Plantae.Rhodophyta-Purpureofilum_apyrenoidigerum.ctg25137~~Plantae.Rhodophyta-Purpureofilum_apyrenoidigerum.ctg25137.p2  ORF type:complete len:102 (+),score=6.15 Plantae.Rhodophyta-Purpureofilum_apyrenoidigerum.ctg25137:284-589(+)
MAFISGFPGTISRAMRLQDFSCHVEQEARTANGDKCPGCGREGGSIKGCNGEGRIAGGIGAVLDWWPIKAYRPCPEYTKNKTYRRSGQSLSEIGFGKKSSL